MVAIKKFQVNIKGLTEKEQKVLDKLTEACELIAPLYEKQKNTKLKGANFYPPDATKEEIQKAAEKDPSLIHPYTFVERDGRGGLRAIPFSKKFKGELKQVGRLIGEAAKMSEDKDFSNYLIEQARTLQGNDYARNEILWVTRGPFKFNFIIGPIERYLDRLLFQKCAYQAWLGILDKQRTEQAGEFKKIILASRRKILANTEKVELEKMRVELSHTICFSGLIADNMFTGTNLPNDVELMKKHGSNLIIFQTALQFNFQQDQLPVFEKVFPEDIKRSYSHDELYEGTLRCILLHEISHSLIRYRDAEKRLQDIFPVFDEILAYILGIKACGVLLLKGVLNQKELEAILITHLIRDFNWWQNLEKQPAYATGGAMAMNFFLREGAVGIKKGVCYPDFTKLFIAVDHLARILEYYLCSGDYEEAQKFVEEYGSFDIFEKEFSSKLK